LPQAPGGGPYLVWTGFQLIAGGSRVFLQTTQPVAFEVRQAADKKASKNALEIILRGCRIHMANNRRAIDTRFFASPVTSVAARQKGHDVEVRITIRQDVSVTPRNEEGPSGSQFVVIDFPPGTAEVDPGAAVGSARPALSDGEPVRNGTDDSAEPATARKRPRSPR
jgi:hypothetical protein